MAKRAKGRAPAHLVPYQFRPTAPIVITKTRTVHPKKHKGGRRRHHGGSGALTMQRLFALMLGGFVAGYADKEFGSRLPVIPIVGRKGAMTIGLYFAAKNFHIGGGILRDATIAMAGASGYELGFSGKISGDDGLAAQV